MVCVQISIGMLVKEIKKDLERQRLANCAKRMEKYVINAFF